MDNPIEELAHDHRELSGLLLAVHEALSRIERGTSTLDDELHEIRDGIEGFREASLEHFAREQEGLLPFVLERVPSAQGRVDQLIVDHDRIADALTSLVRALDAVADGGDPPALHRSLARFEELYAAHTKEELAFLGEIAASLADDPAAADRLRTLLDEP